VDVYFCLLFLSLIYYYLFYSDFICRHCFGVSGLYGFLSGAQHRSGWIWDSVWTPYTTAHASWRSREAKQKIKEQQFEICAEMKTVTELAAHGHGMDEIDQPRLLCLFSSLFSPSYTFKQHGDFFSSGMG